MGTFHIRIQLFPNLRGGCYSQACWKHLIYTTDKHTLGVSNFFLFFCLSVFVLFSAQISPFYLRVRWQI